MGGRPRAGRCRPGALGRSAWRGGQHGAGRLSTLTTLWFALCVAAGAVVGALARWVAALWLNPLWMGFPLGTLMVNVVGGLLAGVAYVVFGRQPNEAARLLLVTGFLGGLTTFPSFSMES